MRAAFELAWVAVVSVLLFHCFEIQSLIYRNRFVLWARTDQISSLWMISSL
jgi:hypothetical protein